MQKFSILVIVAMLSACASTYKQEPVSIPTAKLLRGKSILIATPKSGSYEKKEYPESGKQTAAVALSAFARFSDQVTVSSSCSDLPCLQAEAKQPYGYYVVPEILHWEDRNTEWSGIPDKIEVKLIVIDGESSKEIASVVISGKSKWATFGGDHPQDLLPEPVKQYVASLY